MLCVYQNSIDSSKMSVDSSEIVTDSRYSPDKNEQPQSKTEH